MPVSALYEGRIEHRRLHPQEHRLSYRVFLAWIDLAELPGVLDPFPGWSARGRSVAEFRRSDYLGPADVPLGTAVRDRVEAAGHPRPAGPIRLLTHLRTFGFVFNPATFYYVFDAEDREIERVVVEVTNTPWKERIAYVLSPEPSSTATVVRASHDKALHVSPFMGMDQRYRWRLSQPGERLGIHVESVEDERVMLRATVALERREMTRSRLLGALVRYPLMTARVVFWIHLHAFFLWRKGVPVHDHPRLRTEGRLRPEGELR